MSEDIENGLIPILIIMFMLILGCVGGPSQKDQNNKKILNSIRYGDTFKVSSGFYSGCNFTVTERKTFWTFTGGVTKCPNFNDIQIGIEPVDIYAPEFVPGVQAD